MVELEDHMKKVSKGKSRSKREALLPYQCVLDKSEGFRCFNPGKSITICETKPIEGSDEPTTTYITDGPTTVTPTPSSSARPPPTPSSSSTTRGPTPSTPPIDTSSGKSHRHVISMETIIEFCSFGL